MIQGASDHWESSKPSVFLRASAAMLCVLVGVGCWRSQMPTAAEHDLWERENPIQALPRPPLGINVDFASLPDPPTPERVRLGRWLFFDTRLSRDNTLSCGSCHQPDTAFARPSPIALASGPGVGTRKVPTIINLANPRPPTFFKGVPAAFFWDGRATTLQAQALEPIANPGEMASSHEDMVDTLSSIPGYAPHFSEAFGDARITKERVGQAIADYERTRMSGNSAFDRWRTAGDDTAPYLDVRIPPQPLGLTSAEVDAVVRFLESLDGEGWQDRAPSRFPDDP